MNREQIQVRQEQLTAQFNSLRQSLDSKREEIINGEKELDKLSGRYAELEDMKQQVDTKPGISSDTPASNVIEAKAEKKSGK